MSEVARLKGLLREKELKAREIEMRMGGHIKAIHDALPRHVPVMELLTRVAAEEAITLAALHTALQELQEEIRSIRKDLDA